MTEVFWQAIGMGLGCMFTFIGFALMVREVRKWGKG